MANKSDFDYSRFYSILKNKGMGLKDFVEQYEGYEKTIFNDYNFKSKFLDKSGQVSYERLDNVADLLDVDPEYLQGLKSIRIFNDRGELNLNGDIFSSEYVVGLINAIYHTDDILLIDAEDLFLEEKTVSFEDSIELYKNNKDKIESDIRIILENNNYNIDDNGYLIPSYVSAGDTKEERELQDSSSKGLNVFLESWASSPSMNAEMEYLTGIPFLYSPEKGLEKYPHIKELLSIKIQKYLTNTIQQWLYNGYSANDIEEAIENHKYRELEDNLESIPEILKKRLEEK